MQARSMRPAVRGLNREHERKARFSPSFDGAAGHGDRVARPSGLGAHEGGDQLGRLVFGPQFAALIAKLGAPLPVGAKRRMKFGAGAEPGEAAAERWRSGMRVISIKRREAEG